MRTLVIGLPLPHPSFDNHTFFSAPSFADYRRLVVEMSSVAAVVEEVVAGTGAHATYGGQAVVKRESTAYSFGLADILRMRRREAEWFFEHEGTLILFACPDGAIPGIEGVSSWRLYDWLPPGEGFTWQEALLPSFGRPGAQATGEEHSFAPLIHNFGLLMAHRVRLEGSTFAGHVFARSEGRIPIAATTDIRLGSAVLLPPVRLDSGRPAFGEALLQCLEAWENERARSASGAPERVRKEVP